ncbi:hypothetical protein DTX80_15470 [Bacilli bacterium]|nr:hypothetical protein DEJ64_05085 [Bacilli bacterium]PZD90635.1 hypothetical protein DEJ60_01885 [Bacilli bacterium]PZD91887.1 hypothetical protein DEJ66_05605 [Bacilli bacterium]RCO04694.1 hypothetical protein DTX80_15470 [Bacilli bacterium]RCO07837.1 hypothetical protein DTX79_18280 [Bacilli bacterium]
MDSIYSPWFLLLPLDSQRVKRFMPAGLFVAVLYTVIFQIAEVWNWWDVHEENNIFFLTNISSFVYGFLIVITIYMFYFTYPNFWLFLIANWIIDFIQALIISPFIFQKVGLYTMNNMSNFGLFVMIAITVPVVYLYQRWQDSALRQSDNNDR